MRRSHQLPLLFLSLLLFVSPRGFASDAEPSPRPETSERHRFVLLAGAMQIFDTNRSALRFRIPADLALARRRIVVLARRRRGRRHHSAIGLLYDFRIGARWRLTPSLASATSVSTISIWAAILNFAPALN